MTRYEVPRPGDHAPVRGPHAVWLRPVASSDVPNLWRWRHDPEVVRWWDAPPASEEELAQEDLEPDVDPCWRFIIVAEGRDVGLIQYGHDYADTDYDWSAYIDIYIGEPDARERGTGTEALRTLLAYLFEVKRVHRVTIDPEVENARAIRAYQKAGFRLDGVLRHNDRRTDGSYLDTQYLSILEDEWPEAKARWLAA